MTIEEWLTDACADADRRGLDDLKPLLASLADSTKALRRAEWDAAGPDGRLPASPRASVSDRGCPAGDAARRPPSEEGAAR